MDYSPKKIDISDEKCPVKATLSILGGKWTLIILYQINNRVIRYGELKRSIPGISEKMLIQSLNQLIEHGLVDKKAYPEIPPRVEYSLTEIGFKSLPIIDKLEEFGRENLI
ncbi:helix-turn-helix domain-containing protein [Muricauda sp. 334s03]|uniref:Helix-turn-helix domain-containing protein n=2 Tax=Flagellimonas TaxID=444459 RepID=A0ABT5XNG6_9FLAO|nr:MULTISPECIES: helix-turn-helix domain-containing protein [Allomuricauda]MDF0707430.1 helix-turn-helix domain-containing protein [[Muricauda] okinawensis]MDF0715330.1 helix-turn-helix domain-containing protein [[Muricauda] yonaguniensis]